MELITLAIQPFLDGIGECSLYIDNNFVSLRDFIYAYSNLVSKDSKEVLAGRQQE